MDKISECLSKMEAFIRESGIKLEYTNKVYQFNCRAVSWGHLIWVAENAPPRLRLFLLFHEWYHEIKHQISAVAIILRYRRESGWSEDSIHSFIELEANTFAAVAMTLLGIEYPAEEDVANEAFAKLTKKHYPAYNFSEMLTKHKEFFLLTFKDILL